MSQSLRIPKRLFQGEVMNSMLLSMHGSWERQNEALDKLGYTGRRVLGYKLPVWQREEEWSQEQSIRFIQSVYLGIGLGTFMVNRSFLHEDLDLLLLDGQQRLRALERYWSGELAVPGEDGNAYTWNELTKEEQAHCFRMTFPWIDTKYETEAMARLAYNLLNFGGTPHREDQRA
jgi:hypothetical protein